MQTKFILITGGVLSSLGKGLSAAAIGAVMEPRGLRVINVKMDPYLNVDPGTISADKQHKRGSAKDTRPWYTPPGGKYTVCAPEKSPSRDDRLGRCRPRLVSVNAVPAGRP